MGIINEEDDHDAAKDRSSGSIEMTALSEFLFPAPAKRTAGAILGWWEKRRLSYNAAVGSAGLVSVGLMYPRSVDGDDLTPLGPHRYPTDRGIRKLFDSIEVRSGVSRQILEPADVFRTLLPPWQRLVDRLYGGE